MRCFRFDTDIFGKYRLMVQFCRSNKISRKFIKTYSFGFFPKGRFFVMLSAEKEAIPMWQYVNKNPRSKCVGDCTVRAISIATNNGWMETYLVLCLFGLLMADMPSANAVTTSYLKTKGFRRRTIPDDCPDCYTIEDFCKDHPKGTFVIGTGSH